MSDLSSPPVPSSRGGRATGAAIGLGLVALLGYGAVTHVERARAVRALADTRRDQAPEVLTMVVHADTTPIALDLPGETAPLETAAIGARASGYIEKRFVDIGTPVKAGQVLALIRAPELDRQVARAQAALAQAQADLDLARVTARRSAGLVGGGAVSRQNFDVDRITQQARLAEQDAARAALADIAQRQAYTTITAPFDGVVTARTVEAGDLVNADNVQAAPLFVVARTDRLRVRVHVPQDQAAGLAVGTQATLSLPARPDQHFSGTVTRTGHALERDSRMLPVEIELDNPDGRLAAGLYATIHFDLPRAGGITLIPAEALNYEADGLSVDTVSPDHHVTIRHVTVGRDYGDRLEILGGLPDGSQLIVHPPSALHDGSPVAPHSDSDTKGA
ncbi:efflux RND transporter periplasmic adaptor subunit [Gluconacetobacter asukensis]|uniref:Efflux RND transporter periplasmic adaptor subunit n=1 Tax=Gluconacetobacter asukensis TaxID=1017181 RepID=A0A7W4NZZ9_9PROT|nr:efflux RND transporter periplasmic adaptor subunit [Gluconacetobacter asukensis]MBB2172139.1 efflux RND transporter periplasmic adaptor subunit [Gluconacetobacter asukensis]